MSHRIALCVAEKPSVAKAIAELLSGGKHRKFISQSKYNPVYEFKCNLGGESRRLRVTSVLGHIMNLKYPDECKDWLKTDMESLYEIELEKVPIETSVPVVKNLLSLCTDVDELVIWTDCDREGEAIGYDIIDVCRKR